MYWDYRCVYVWSVQFWSGLWCTSSPTEFVVSGVCCGDVRSATEVTAALSSVPHLSCPRGFSLCAPSLCTTPAQVLRSLQSLSPRVTDSSVFHTVVCLKKIHISGYSTHIHKVTMVVQVSDVQKLQLSHVVDGSRQTVVRTNWVQFYNVATGKLD